MFKKPIKKAYKGDRVGMLIKNLESSDLERSIACGDSSQISSINGGVFLLRKVKYYKSEVESNSKIFIIIGNQGVNAKCTFFGNNIEVESLLNDSKKILKEKENKVDEVECSLIPKRDFEFSEKIRGEEYNLALIKFNNKLFNIKDSLVVGINVDSDISNKVNRIAFYGTLIKEVDFGEVNTNSVTSFHKSLINIVKHKTKTGKILRMHNDKTAIVIEMFKKDSNIEDFIGKKVMIQIPNELANEEARGSLSKISGIIRSSFGQSGKVKIEFNINLKDFNIVGDNEETITWKDLILYVNYVKKIKM